MEAPLKAVAIASSLAFPLPGATVQLPKQSTGFFQNGVPSNALPLKCRASSPCYCSPTASISVADQRLAFMLSVGSAVIPHPAKVEKGGEDAFFVSSYNGGVLGVADGVSGCADENVDPALFSRELMEHAITALDSEVVGTCPRQLLTKAYEETSATGAATVIVAILEKEVGILHVANLGDCGLRVVRKGKIVFATSIQQHYFDCPYQLSSEPGAQTSEDAKIYKVELCPGDIVVMGSDGLFDNVFNKDIERIINLFGGSDGDVPQRIASALASLASKHSRDVKYESPYAQEAVLQGYDLPFWKKLLGQKLTGGKLDDITVVTAHVVLSVARPKDPPIESVKTKKPLIESVKQEEPLIESVKQVEPLIESDKKQEVPLIESDQREESPIPVEPNDTDFPPNPLLAPVG